VDAVLVAAYADAVLLTVRWGVTSELTVLAALDELNIFSVPVAGIVLNGVDPHSQSYEAMYPLFDHRTSAPDRRQQGRLSEEASVRSRIHLKTANVTRLNSTGSDYPSTPPM
jgi:Mrp family chromosome partitioning ATPase